MSDAGAPPFDVNQVLRRFPGDTDAISILIGESEEFRSLCEDYSLASETLSRLEAKQRAQDAAKIEDYRAILRELERDIAVQLARAKRPPQASTR